MDEQLLSGIRVLDLSQDIAGPYMTRLMAGLGADVVKVEPPSGDPSRRSGPFPDHIPHREKSALYLYLNTSKRGVTLDLWTTTGRDLLSRLVAYVDLVVETYRPGTLDELGLGYDSLAEANPRVVLTSITPFGQNGPYSQLPAEELTLYALSGLMYLTGEPDEEPLKEGPAVTQYGAGQMALVGTLAALWQADATGEGQHVDVSMAENNTAILENAVAAYSYTGRVVPRTGNRGYGRAAWGIYPCRDGYVGVIAGPDRRWPAMVDLTDILELGDPRFASRRGRLDYADEIDAYVMPWMLDHDKEDIFTRAQELGLAFSYVATPQDLLHNVQLEARNYFSNVDHPEAGDYTYPGPPFRVSDSSWELRSAPTLGQHNHEVFCEGLGLSDAELVQLRASGVI